MSDPTSLPISSVVYCVSFDAAGKPTIEGKIHVNVAGDARFEGDPARAYSLLKTASNECVNRLRGSFTRQIQLAAREKAVLQQELQSEPPQDDNANL